jgi:3-oxoacyl-[acyl-carrier protein] reductase
MDLGLNGKTALVAGAGADVGRATAILLAREGVEVVLAGRRREALEETARQVEAAGGIAHVARADLAQLDGAKELVAQAASTCGRIDLLANTVGPFPDRSLDPTPPAPIYQDDESWTGAFNTILMPAVRLMREIMPLMKGQGAGAVVHLGSNSARHYSSMTAQYAAMKAALVHAVKNWARDGAEAGVRVNGVLPGWIRGERLVEVAATAAKKSGISMDEAERSLIAGHDSHYWTPRIGRPEEFAAVVVFLLSERASYVNGALCPVDGGSPVW